MIGIETGIEIPKPISEYKFHPHRKWRLDNAWPEYRLAVEIEGSVWTQGRHTRGSGFVKDLEKYNELAKMGWWLLRFTPQQVKNGYAWGQIAEWFDNYNNTVGFKK